MRTDHKYMILEHETQKALGSAVDKELFREVCDYLERHNEELNLTDEQLGRLAHIGGAIAAEAYWRGYNRLAPPDF